MRNGLFSFLVIAFVCSGSVFAGTIPGAMPRETLTFSPTLSQWSIGVQGEGIIDRKMEYKNMTGETELTAAAVAVFLGYDVTPWYSVFATMGASEVEYTKLDGKTEWSDPKMKWSVGVNANLWHYEIIDPDFLKGRVSIKGVAEFARYDSEYEMGDTHWFDISASLPLCYEVFVDYGEHKSDGVYSSLIYIGPGISYINGRTSTSRSRYDFDEAQSLGIVGGIDLYFSHNFSFGIYGQYFDGGQVGTSLHYHF